jgi:lysophospholipase
MIDIVTAPFPAIAARRIANIACAAGFGEAYVLGGTNYLPGKICFETNRLTHDLERFNNEQRLIAQTPDLALGDVTYAWLKAAFDSIQLLKARSYARQITTPVMLVSADEDRVVSIAAQHRMARDLPECQLVCIPNAHHEILHETDTIRRAFWNHFDAFTA